MIRQVVAGAVVAFGLWAGDPAHAQGKHAALIVDGNNGAVLHADQADELRYPASLTKMMTIYLAFEAIERGRASYATRLKVSQEAASAAPTKLDLDPGETIALIDAIKSLITKSANDAAIVIAEHLGGTEANFARMMTAKARLFGMSRTTFRNASGLPDPEQVTSARDMVRLALRLQDDFPQHYALFSTRSFTYDGSTYRNHNNLLYRFQGTDGIKTGYTRASGFNLVSSVRRGGRHVVGAIFGGTSAARRDDAMQLLLSRALMRSSPYKTRRPTPVLVAAAEPARRPVPGIAAGPVIAQGPVQSPPLAPRPVMVPHRPRQQPGAAAIATAPAFAAPAGVAIVPAPVPAARPQLAANPQFHASYQPSYPHQPNKAAGGDASQRLAFAPRGAELRGTDPAVLPVHPATTPQGAAAQGPARGAPPSTFNQQAATLARAEAPAAAAIRPQMMPPPYAVRGPAIAPAPIPAVQKVEPGVAASGGYEVQIGAFATNTEAEKALQSARGAAADLLASSQARAVAARKDARQIYRARFVGFDSRTAAATCLELRRRQIDCFVMRAE